MRGLPDEGLSTRFYNSQMFAMMVKLKGKMAEKKKEEHYKCFVQCVHSTSDTSENLSDVLILDGVIILPAKNPQFNICKSITQTIRQRILP